MAGHETRKLELTVRIRNEQVLCEQQIRQTEREVRSASKSSCPPVWDSVMCWPQTQANFLQHLSCPEYIPGFDPRKNATRFCTSNATWFSHEEQNKTWTNYTDCNISRTPEIIETWLPIIKKMSQIGYAVSFVALVMAFIILISIKRLRCPRNTLHMHLFFSFMLRAFMTVLKTWLFVEGIGLANSVILEEKTGQKTFNYEHPNWECKLIVSVWQYALVANYFWILMEGLYLHNLIFLAPFSDSSAITLYVLLGWGCPLIVVIFWVLARGYYDDVLCWTTNDSENTVFNFFRIIQIPIVASIGLNFLLFLNIIRVLLVKLQSAVSIETRKYRYRKWAKSTLVLVPLFGVHYMVLIGLSYYVNKDPVIEVIWLFCDQLFASFQGFFVSVLYCLLNGEVRSELRKLWGTWRSQDGGDKSIPLYRISLKFRTSAGGDNSPPNELTEEQHLNDVTSCDEKRKRSVVTTTSTVGGGIGMGRRRSRGE